LSRRGSAAFADRARGWHWLRRVGRFSRFGWAGRCGRLRWIRRLWWWHGWLDRFNRPGSCDTIGRDRLRSGKVAHCLVLPRWLVCGALVPWCPVVLDPTAGSLKVREIGYRIEVTDRWPLSWCHRPVAGIPAAPQAAWARGVHDD
jgi:hypothetical protein